MEYLFLLIFLTSGQARTFCDNMNTLELGKWQHKMKHMDSAIVENQPVSMTEGQIYVYDNHFPGHSIQYIHVDNLARRSCGASATLKSGGIGFSSVLIVLHAGPKQEIRTVIDIWGVKEQNLTQHSDLKSRKSLYLFSDMRAVNHNGGLW